VGPYFHGGIIRRVFCAAQDSFGIIGATIRDCGLYNSGVAIKKKSGPAFFKDKKVSRKKGRVRKNGRPGGGKRNGHR